jgi:hypothetical protein
LAHIGPSSDKSNAKKPKSDRNETTMSTAQEKIEALAKMMGASYTDTVIFLEHVALWMSSGLSQEDAVKMHLKTMQEGCAIALGKV